MTAYTSARALEALPSGGTRLHRAILKGDTEAMLGWTQAGADPWAMSGYLPDNLRARIWGSETQSGGTQRPKGPHQLSAMALAVLLVTEATWPAVQAMLARTDLGQDTEGWVFEAATLSKKPPTAWEVEAATWRKTPLPPHRPDDLWSTLLAHGLLPPAKDRLPSAEHWYARRTSALASLPTSWRQAMEAHWGLARLAQVFTPEDSPLDHLPPDQDSAATWAAWIEGGLPIDAPQNTLLNWIEHAPSKTSEDDFSRVVQALVARGARLDQSAQRTGVDRAYWPTPAGWAVDKGHLDRAELLQRLQGRTLADEAGAPGSWSPTVEVVGRNAFLHPPQFRFSGLLTCVRAGLDPVVLGPTAKGWHALLAHLSVTQPQNAQDVVYPLQSWLRIANQLQVPAVGHEAGRPYAVVDTYVAHMATLLTQHAEKTWSANLTADVEALAQLTREAPEAFAQAQLHRLATNGQVVACAWWGSALERQGAQWDRPGVDGQTPRTHLLRDLSSVAQADVLAIRLMLHRLADIGVTPWTVDDQGRTIWDHWSKNHKLAWLAEQESIRLDWRTEAEYFRFDEVRRRLKGQLKQAGVAGWFEAPNAKGPLTRLERFAQTDPDLCDWVPKAADLAGRSALDRAIALMPILQQGLAQPPSSEPLNWDGALRFVITQARQAELERQTSAPLARPRPRA